MLQAALVLAGIACFAVHFWCETQCTRLDVETGRRDAGALIDDYGSNRGWYPRWKIPSMLSMFAGIALWLHAVGACTMLVQAHDHNRPDLNGWYRGLNSGKGACCDGSDVTKKFNTAEIAKHLGEPEHVVQRYIWHWRELSRVPRNVPGT